MLKRASTAGTGRAPRSLALTAWPPGLQMLRGYDRSWLRQDLVAGFVLTTMLVPVGIAYAVASGVPGIYGLYATIVPLLAYALFGPSRILVLGPDSSLAAVILGVVLPLSAGDPVRAVALASAMALVSGTVCIVAGLARLGFVTELLSKPIRYGYMNGIALTVLISQLPKLFGFSIESTGPLRNLIAIGRGIADGQAPLPGRAPDSRARAVPLGRAAVLRQRRAVQGPQPGRSRSLADPGAAAGGGRAAGDQHRRHRRRQHRRAGEHAERGRGRTQLRRARGSGEG
jgi:hypothetical protein